MNGQLPLFYRKVVPLSTEKHGDLYIDPEPGYGFARETNCVYIAGTEFPNACKEYAIVFAGDGAGGVVPVVLLGLRNGQNLFVGDDNQWLGTYVPAYVRRYPFILAADEKGESFTVCIDEAYPGFNTAREGQPLLGSGGEHGELLERSVEFLKDYQQQTRLTAEFCKRLQSLELLEPVQANVEMHSGERFSLAGFHCVNKDKLKGLTAEQLQDLVKDNYMDLVYAHLLSLGNMNALLNRMPSRAAGSQSEQAEA